VRRYLRAADGRLAVGTGARRSSLSLERLFVAGAGKASAGMAAAVAHLVPDAPGLVIRPEGGAATLSGQIRQYGGNHPTPGLESFRATEALLDAVTQTPAETEILFLLSGGASALLAQPCAGVSREEKASFTELMLRAGAPIGLLNRARLRLSSLKGGRFAREVFPRRVTTLALSDVPGGAPWEIGSGPTCCPPDKIWAEDLRPALQRLLGGRTLSEEVERRMGPGKPPAGLGVPAGWMALGDNARARQAAAREARGRGYGVRVSRYRLRGEASGAAVRVLAELAMQPESVSCVVFGGETTVAVGEAAGSGGRSQELALAAVKGLSEGGWVLLAAGTDGVDGVSGATGAVVGPGTLAFLGAGAVAGGLRMHDSATILAKAQALLVTGPTGTNVGDLVVALRSSGKNSVL
jgi:glycerate 2-kinase